MTEFNWISSNTFGASGFETEWTTVHQARQGGAGGDEALEQLCCTYWYPLYAYVRGQGFERHEAQDLTQEFFSRLLGKPWLQNVHPAKGRFRAFLLAAMNKFLVDEWRREHAAKRGGGRELFSLDALAADQRFKLEPAHDESPDRLFDRSWAATVSAQALVRLRNECLDQDKAALFDAVQPLLAGGKSAEPQAVVAQRLNLSPAALRKALQRLRERHLELIRHEVARTVDGPAELDAELRHILDFLND
jgi:RNA polymerase sigma-70 factor (ECF subfamily)